jgi:AcrR family transcriptional regulator
MTVGTEVVDEVAVETRAKRGRGGRPKAGTPSDVEARLLAAATRLFLTRGYDGTSCDQVALDAHAGKASIYARYANKAALFTAVIDRQLAGPQVDDALAEGASVDARMAAVGMAVLIDALGADALALLRLLVAELPRLGDAAARADQLFWQAGVKRLSAAISPHDAAEAAGVASNFIDMALAPQLLRALLGEAVAPLLAAAPARIEAAIALLRANGTLNAWS